VTPANGHISESKPAGGRRWGRLNTHRLILDHSHQHLTNRTELVIVIMHWMQGVIENCVVAAVIDPCLPLEWCDVFLGRPGRGELLRYLAL